MGSRKQKRIIARVTFVGGGYYDAGISSVAADKQGIDWDVYVENFVDDLNSMRGAVKCEIVYDSERG